MSLCVDGFVVPVPASRVAGYRRMARKFGRIWIEHGALTVQENIADDVKPGQRTSFPQAVKLKEGEVMVLSWITYKSRRHRDAVNRAVMANPRVAGIDAASMPFDSKRMFWGGLKALVALKV
jgi:uncharacterized protein YbaA (DUF1428 family)